MTCKRYKLIFDPSDSWYCIFDNLTLKRDIWVGEVRELTINKNTITKTTFNSYEEFETFYKIDVLCEFETLEELKSEYPEYFI